MATIDGAMLGGYFLPEKEFKQILKDKILSNNKNIEKINDIIDKAILAINNQNLLAFYTEIEKLEVELLKNPETSLMVITNVNNQGENMKYYYHHSEKDTLTKGGTISRAKALKDTAIKEALSKTLSKHLSNMIMYIENGILEDIDGFFNSGKYKFSSKKQKSEMGERGSHSEYNLKYIIYGDKTQYLGQVADAFLNHLGNYHKIIFENNFKKNITIKSTVMEEEGENFYQRLIDSTNSTG